MLVDKSWGFEHIIVNTELYCLKRIVVYAGKTSSDGRFHYHKKKDETFIIQSGRLLIDIDGKTCNLGVGEQIRVFPGQRHRFTATYADCQFLEVSTHHEDSDSYYD